MRITPEEIFNFLENILSDINIILISILISVFLVIQRNKKLKKYCKKKNNIDCFFISLIHYFIGLIIYLYLLKLAILPFKLIPYLIISILIVSIIFFGFIFKSCFLNAFDNKCRKCPTNLAFPCKIMSNDEVKTIKNGYVSRMFTESIINRGFLGIYIIVSLKSLVEIIIERYY